MRRAKKAQAMTILVAICAFALIYGDFAFSGQRNLGAAAHTVASLSLALMVIALCRILLSNGTTEQPTNTKAERN